MRTPIVVAIAWLFMWSASHAQSNRLVLRVVDVGAGLCCIVKTPDEHFMVFDAGNYKDHGASAMLALRNMIPYGSTIDLMVLSHCDSDHVAAVPFICEQYQVKEVWRDGFDNGRDTWARMNDAVQNEEDKEGCLDYNLQDYDLDPGYSVAVGEATATFLCGFAEIPPEWGLGSGGENRNARSVVVRLDYGHSSVLFGGDTVGRHIGAPDTQCIAAEAVLVERSTSVSIDVDVVIAPHHGADNGSSMPFIEAMSPRYVVFSAGSQYKHPHAAAARRYLRSGVPIANIFRTDRGDNEGGEEWRSTSGAAPDRIGDDDVELMLARSGHIEINYRPRSESWFNPRLVDSWAPQAFSPNLAAREALPPEIAKWVDDDSLWTEDNSDLESHTLFGTHGETRDASETTYCRNPSRPCCRGPRLFWRLHRCW